MSNENINHVSDFLANLYVLFYVYKRKCIKTGYGMFLYVNFRFSLSDITPCSKFAQIQIE